MTNLEETKILTNIEVAKLLLEKNGYNDVTIKIEKHDVQAKCVMHDDTFTLHLGPISTEPMPIMVASHECSHGFNYSEGKSDYNFLKKLDHLFLKSFFILAPITAILSFTPFDVLCWLITLIFMVIVVLQNAHYMPDEVRTQKRALSELEELQKSHGISFDMRAIRKAHNKKLYREIYLNTAKTIIITTTLFVCLSLLSEGVNFLKTISSML